MMNSVVMQQPDADAGWVIIGALVLFGLVLSVLWMLLPFAVFGVKDLLRRIHRELQTIDKRLQILTEETKRLRASDEDETQTRTYKLTRTCSKCGRRARPQPDGTCEECGTLIV